MNANILWIAVPFLCVLIVIVVARNKANPPADKPVGKGKLDEDTREPEPSQKKGGQGGGHYGVLKAIFWLAFFGALAYVVIVYGVPEFQRLQHYEKVQHSVRVERPGPGHVPVTVAREFDVEDAHYCQRARDNAREFPASSKWSEEVKTPESHFCSDPGPRMGGFKAECREYEGSLFAPCTTLYFAVRFTTTIPRKVWVERLRYK